MECRRNDWVSMSKSHAHPAGWNVTVSLNALTDLKICLTSASVETRLQESVNGGWQGWPLAPCWTSPHWCLLDHSRFLWNFFSRQLEWVLWQTAPFKTKLTIFLWNAVREAFLAFLCKGKGMTNCAYSLPSKSLCCLSPAGHGDSSTVQSTGIRLVDWLTVTCLYWSQSQRRYIHPPGQFH